VRRILRVARVVLANVAVLVLIAGLLEGFAGFLEFTLEVKQNARAAVPEYARYDSTLGWVPRPNVDMPNQFGPGAFLRTNAMGFRADRDYSRNVPAGKIRIVCSGDSYTFGYGVGNDQTWCHRLMDLDARVETVNMGQGGFGVDQAYLWYKRDGVPLDHHLHLFAFVDEDFNRMESDRFAAFGKPLLGLRHDSVVVLNAPVPRTSAFLRWAERNRAAIMGLHISRILGRTVGARRSPIETAGTAYEGLESTRRVASHIFAELARTNREKSSQLVLVYLPRPIDYRQNTAWSRFVRDEAKRQGIVLIDLVDTLRRVPPQEVGALFLPDNHYSSAGNEFIARALYEQLQRLNPGMRTQ
jgi:hypothetical protein